MLNLIQHGKSTVAWSKELAESVKQPRVTRYEMSRKGKSMPELHFFINIIHYVEREFDPVLQIHRDKVKERDTRLRETSTIKNHILEAHVCSTYRS